jgi:hypothetical protein
MRSVSGGGFAGSPDVPAGRLGPGIIYSLHAGYRVECETSGLGMALPRLEGLEAGRVAVVHRHDLTRTAQLELHEIASTAARGVRPRR